MFNLKEAIVMANEKKQQKAPIGIREKLLEVGTKLVAEKGFNKISVEEITKTAGVAKGSFYTYFKRKEDLIQEINRSATSTVIDEVISLQNADIEDKLQLYVVRFINKVQENDIQICRQWLCNMLNPQDILDAKDKEKLDRDCKDIRNILKDEISAGRLKKKTPVSLVANLLVCQIYGMLACWCMSNGEFSPKEWARFFCEAQIRPILKQYLK